MMRLSDHSPIGIGPIKLAIAIYTSVAGECELGRCRIALRRRLLMQEAGIFLTLLQGYLLGVGDGSGYDSGVLAFNSLLAGFTEIMTIYASGVKGGR